MNVHDIAWSQEMNINITSIDHQHKQLAEKLTLLKICYKTNSNTDMFLNVFDDLIDLMREHFIHEEQIMNNIGYDDSEKHARVHANVLQKTMSYRGAFSEKTDQDQLARILKFLDGIISGHLSVEDRKIYDFMHRT